MAKQSLIRYRHLGLSTPSRPLPGIGTLAPFCPPEARILPRLSLCPSALLCSIPREAQSFVFDIRDPAGRRVPLIGSVVTSTVAADRAVCNAERLRAAFVAHVRRNKGLPRFQILGLGFPQNGAVRSVTLGTPQISTIIPPSSAIFSLPSRAGGLPLRGTTREAANENLLGALSNAKSSPAARMRLGIPMAV